MTVRISNIMSSFIYIKSFKEETAYSVPSMALYLVFVSCLATIRIAAWKIFEQVIQFPLHVEIIETCPREIGFVLWGHCQNLLDDPLIYTFPNILKHFFLFILYVTSHMKFLQQLSWKFADGILIIWPIRSTSF